MILVTGATGHFGKAAIDFLLKKGVAANTIAALVRDEAKAAGLKAKGIILKTADYTNYDALVSAFKDVDKLLFVSGSDIASRAEQQRNVVQAAKEAGVKHIIYTSFERKNETETSPIAFVAQAHIETEQLIKASGIPYTIFRNNLYADILPMFLGEKVLETGVFFPAGDTKSALTVRNDMAEAAANVLTSEGHENKEYGISNPEHISFHEIAAMLGELSGKPVAYLNPDQATYTDSLSKAGVPAEYIGLFAGFGEAIKQGEFVITQTDLEKLLGRKPTSVKTYLAEAYASKN